MVTTLKSYTFWSLHETKRRCGVGRMSRVQVSNPAAATFIGSSFFSPGLRVLRVVINPLIPPLECATQLTPLPPNITTSTLQHPQRAAGCIPVATEGRTYSAGDGVVCQIRKKHTAESADQDTSHGCCTCMTCVSISFVWREGSPGWNVGMGLMGRVGKRRGTEEKRGSCELCSSRVESKAFGACISAGLFFLLLALVSYTSTTYGVLPIIPHSSIIHVPSCIQIPRPRRRRPRRVRPPAGLDAGDISPCADTIIIVAAVQRSDSARVRGGAQT